MDAASLNRLRHQGHRLTPQRLAILDIIQESNRHMSPVAIVEVAQSRLPGITEATVYRTLDFLAGAGLILAGHIGSGQIVYESADRAHHHLICHICGGSVDIDHSRFRSLYHDLEQSSGYKIDSVHVTLFGICPSCQSQMASR
jgi:Fe2+ or Zn2+ uptake regulation protein